MRRIKSVGFLLSGVLVGHVQAAPGDQVVPPIEVTNLIEIPSNSSSAIASGNDGNSVVVYISNGSTPYASSGSIVSQRFDASGMPAGDPTMLVQPNEAGMDTQGLQVALTEDNRIRLVWQARNVAGDFDVRAKFIGSFDNPFEPLITVTDTVVGDQVKPSLALDELGHAIVSWSQSTPGGYRPMARVLNWDGSEFAPEFELSQTDSSQPNKTIATAGKCCGGYVVWAEPVGSPATGTTILAKAIQFWFATTTPSTIAQFDGVTSVPFSADYDMAGKLNVAALHEGVLRYTQTDGSFQSLIPLTALYIPTYLDQLNSDLFMASDYQSRSVIAFSRLDNIQSSLNLVNIDSAQLTPMQTIHTSSSFDFPQEKVELSGLSADFDGDTAIMWKHFQPAHSIQSSLMTARHQGQQNVDLAMNADSEVINVMPGNQVQLNWFTAIDPLGCLNWASDPSICSATGMETEWQLSPLFFSEAPEEFDPNMSCSIDTTLLCRRDDIKRINSGVVANVSLKAPMAVGSYPFTVTTDAMQFDADGADNSVSGVIYVGDANPDNLNFPPRNNVGIYSLQTSDVVALQGMEVPGRIRFQGSNEAESEISINGGPFLSSLPYNQTVQNGDTIQLRHRASWSFNSSMITSVYIADAYAEFRSTTFAQDTTPDVFAFSDTSGVTRSSVQTASITISGLNSQSMASIVGGEFSLDGGAFSAASRNVMNGAVVTVRHTASANFATATNTTLTVGGVSDTFTSTTETADTTPDAFAFTDVSNAARGAVLASNAITVSGINASAAISVTGGEYSVNGAAFTSAAGTVNNGQTVVVRHTTSANFATATNTVLTIGGVSDTFTSTTEAQDTTPNAFTFADQTGLATNVLVTSAAITVSGINSASAISVAGGEYSVNGGAFTSVAGTVNAGASIRVRVLTSVSANTATSATLTVGGVSDGFSATTGSVDSTPAAFSFTDVTGARKSRAVTSNTTTVSGINAAVPISVSGGDVKYSKNGGAFTNAAGTVVAGDQIRLQLTASSINNTRIDATATIGGISDVWSVTSGAR